MVVSVQRKYLKLQYNEMDIVYILNIKIKEMIVFVQAFVCIQFTSQKV